MQLVDATDRRVGEPIDMQEWFSFCSFEVTGDLTFGKTFNMLLEGKKYPILGTIQATLSTVFGYLCHLSWAFAVFKKLPIINGAYLGFWAWITCLLDERIAVGKRGLELSHAKQC
jgi:hypothetical protein